MCLYRSSLAWLVLVLLAGCGMPGAAASGPSPAATVAAPLTMTAGPTPARTLEPVPTLLVTTASVASPTPVPRQLPATPRASPALAVLPSTPTPAPRPGARTRLRLCVASVDGSPVPSATLAAITAALLNEVPRHPDFASMNRALYGGQAPEVVSGCPGAPTIRAPDWERGAKGGGAPHRVSRPSDFTGHVYLVSAAEAEHAFGAGFPRRTAHEMLCEGHTCAEVTTAVYLTPDDLAARDRLVLSLTAVVGLKYW